MDGIKDEIDGSCSPRITRSQHTPWLTPTEPNSDLLQDSGLRPHHGTLPGHLKITRSTSSPSSNSSIASAIVKQVSAEAWVQCELPECLKWRRIPQEVADTLGETDPWYCHMNSDPNHNTCHHPAEDYRKSEKLLKKCQLKYKFSVLEPGTMVWAKMSGYCKWPGIITGDPRDDLSCRLAVDGDPLSYHVEFLGRQHTHSWVHHRFVELYGRRTEMDHAPASHHHLKHDKRGRPSIMEKTPLMRAYRGKNVVIAETEANLWLQMKPQERLKTITFKFNPHLVTSIPAPMQISHQEKAQNIPRQERAQKTSQNPVKHIIQPAVKTTEPASLHPQPPLPKRRGRRPGSSNLRPSVKKENTKQIPGIPSRKVSNVQHKMAVTAKKPKYQPPPMEIPSPRVPVETDVANLDDLLNELPHLSHLDWQNHDIVIEATMPGDEFGGCPSSPMGATTILTSPRFCPTGLSLREKINSHSSMLNTTKHDKFNMDVEMYLMNQETFDHDIRTFLKKHGCTLHKLPMWNDVPVTLYQIFLAVYDRGGYNMACQRKQWAAIYRELSGSSSCHGGLVKSFYHKYIYPYEMYQKKQEYKHLIRRSAKFRNKVKVAKEEEGQTDNESMNDGFSSCSELGEVQTMIEEMENLANLLPDNIECGDMPELQLKFYSDSSPGISPNVIMVDLTEFKGTAEHKTMEKVDVSVADDVLKNEDVLKSDFNEHLSQESESPDMAELMLPPLTELNQLIEALPVVLRDSSSPAGQGEQVVPELSIMDWSSTHTLKTGNEKAQQ